MAIYDQIRKLSVIIYYTATLRLNTRNKPYKFFSVTQGRDNIQSLSVIVNVTDEINGVDYCTSLFVLSVIVHYTKLNGIDYWISLFVLLVIVYYTKLNGLDYWTSLFVLSVIVHYTKLNGIDYCTSLFVLSVIVHYTKLNGIDYWTSLFVFVIVNVTATSWFCTCVSIEPRVVVP